MQGLPHILRDLARAQSGALRCSQLDAHGLYAREVQRRIDAGLWQRASSRVIITHASVIDRQTWLWAASLHHRRVGLTGAAALELEGLGAARNRRIDLLGPRGTRKPPFPGCVITTTSSPEFLSDIGPMRTEIALSIAYAMALAASPRQAVFYCTWPIQRRLASLETVRAAVESQPNSPCMAQARRLLDQIDPGVHSTHEYDFARECRKRGLPSPDRQTARLDSRGVRRYTDVEFRIGGKVLIVEIDGVHHLDAEVSLEDQWRANEFTMQGHTVLRVPGLALRTDPEPYFEQIRRSLATMR